MTNVYTPLSVSCSSACSTTGTENPGLLLLLSAASSNPRLPCDQRFLHDRKLSVIVALEVNGSILGMTCSAPNLIKSSPQPSSVPQSLHPTPLQLAMPHYNWIDRWPCPRVRDSMIMTIHLIDVKDLFYDFFTMESFTVKEGEFAWNPHAWQISPEFDAKWGYLFH